MADNNIGKYSKDLVQRKKSFCTPCRHFFTNVILFDGGIGEQWRTQRSQAGALEKTEKHTKRLEYSARITALDFYLATHLSYVYGEILWQSVLEKDKKKNMCIYIYMYFGLLSQCRVTRLIGVHTYCYKSRIWRQLRRVTENTEIIHTIRFRPFYVKY